MAPTPTESPSRRRRAVRIATFVAVVFAAMFVAIPGASAYTPIPTGSVVCTDGTVVLDWTVTVSFYDDQPPPNEWYYAEVDVFVQYGTDGTPIGGPDDLYIASGIFEAGSHSFSGQTTLSPPDGATHVRVHSYEDPEWAETSAWIELPGECEVPPVCEWNPDLSADDPGCTPPPPPVCEWDPELPVEDPDCVPPVQAAPEVSASITYACDTPRIATVSVSSDGGPTTFVVLLDGDAVATLPDVEGDAQVEVEVPTTVASFVVVEADGAEVAAEAVDPADCAEVEGVVRQPTPPTQTPDPAPAPTAPPASGAQVLPRTGVSSTFLAVAALATIGVGAVVLTTGRRAALVEARDHRQG